MPRWLLPGALLLLLPLCASAKPKDAAADSVVAPLNATSLEMSLRDGSALPEEFEVKASSAPDFSGKVHRARGRRHKAKVEGLTPNTQYYMKAEGMETPVVAVTPPAPARNPAVIGAAKDRMDIRWDSGGNPEGTQYRVEMSTDQGFNALGKSLHTAAEDASVGRLAPETQYFIRVQSVGIDGTRAPYSETTSSATDAASPRD